MRPLDTRLLRRARPVRTLLGVDVVIGVASAVLILLQATLLARILARAFAGASLGDVSRDVVLLAIVFAGRAVLVWGFELAGRVASARVLSQLRLELVERRLRDEPMALDSRESAEIAATAVQGIDALDAYFSKLLPQLVLAAIVPLAVVAWVVPVDLTSAVLMVLTLPLVPVFMALIGWYTQRETRAHWQALTLLAAHFLDVVRGLPTLRAFNRGRAQVEAIAEASERYRQTTMRTLRVAFLSAGVLELAATLGIALVAVTVGVRLADGGIGLQAALTVLVLAPELYLPLRDLAAQYHASAEGMAVAGRLLELTGPEAAAVGGPTPPLLPAPRRATLRFEGVSFAYPARAGTVVDGVDLELCPGEVVALVGPSGSGKSTVASLALGLVRPTDGRVTVGGVDLATIDPAEWRRSLAWVPQRPTVLAATVAENIRLGDPGADDERVREAAIRAGAHDFVVRLPDGYETLVGDGGRPLSAGERQRLALARALLREAAFVVLDEPTANLDPESAAVVGDAIARLGGDAAVLVIAHRLEHIGGVDRIVRLDAGRTTPAEVAVSTA